jgi:hypothetical protein
MTRELADDLCWKIITAVAEERDIDAASIEQRLADVIELDAVERLAEQSGVSDSIQFSVSFRLAGCFVTVTDGGRVRASCPGSQEAAGLVEG